MSDTHGRILICTWGLVFVSCVRHRFKAWRVKRLWLYWAPEFLVMWCVMTEDKGCDKGTRSKHGDSVNITQPHVTLPYKFNIYMKSKSKTFHASMEQVFKIFVIKVTWRQSIDLGLCHKPFFFFFLNQFWATFHFCRISHSHILFSDVFVFQFNTNRYVESDYF